MLEITRESAERKILNTFWNQSVEKLTTTFLNLLFLFSSSSISLAQLAQSKLHILYLYFFMILTFYTIPLLHQ